jgi:hypothetical protein
MKSTPRMRFVHPGVLLLQIVVYAISNNVKKSVILSERSESKDLPPLKMRKRVDSSTSPPVGGFAQNDMLFRCANR